MLLLEQGAKCAGQQPISCRRGRSAPRREQAENLFLGREIRRAGLLGNVLRMLDKKKMLEMAV